MTSAVRSRRRRQCTHYDHSRCPNTLHGMLGRASGGWEGHCLHVYSLKVAVMALVWLFKVVFLRGMAYDGGKGECVADASLWKTLQTPLFCFVATSTLQLFIFILLITLPTANREKCHDINGVNEINRLFWAFINIFALSWRLARAVSHRYGIFIMQIGIVQVNLVKHTCLDLSARARTHTHTHTHTQACVWLLSSATWMWWVDD